MSFMPTVVALATAGTVKLRELPMSPYAYWAISFASFLVLLGLLWSFRNTAAKYDTPVRVQHGDSGDSHGSTDPGAHH
jgi:bacteriorhodopsin